jgi:hypothetical protein
MIPFTYMILVGEQALGLLDTSSIEAVAKNNATQQ